MADKYKNSGSGNQITAIEYYWRPGCPFCEGLNKKLKAAKIPVNRRACPTPQLTLILPEDQVSSSASESQPIIQPLEVLCRCEPLPHDTVSHWTRRLASRNGRN